MSEVGLWFLERVASAVLWGGSRLTALAMWLRAPVSRREFADYKPPVPDPPEPLRCVRCKHPGAYVELDMLHRDGAGEVLGVLMNPWVPPEGWERVRVGSLRNYPCDDGEAVHGVLCPSCGVEVRAAVLAVLSVD